MAVFDPGRLRVLRKVHGVSAAELARRMNISPAQLHRLEKGQRRLAVATLLAYCEALGIAAGRLFSNTVAVPVTGMVDSEFEVQDLAADANASTLAPPLVADMTKISALRWAAARRFQPMRNHVVFYQRHEHGVPDVAWNKRCLVMRTNGTRCLGWPIKQDNNVHIDFGNGPVEFNVELRSASPVVAVMPPFVLEDLAQNTEDAELRS